MVFLILSKKMTRCMILQCYINLVLFFTMEMGYDDSKINVYARQIVINYVLLIYFFKIKMKMQSQMLILKYVITKFCIFK